MKLKEKLADESWNDHPVYEGTVANMYYIEGYIAGFEMAREMASAYIEAGFLASPTFTPGDQMKRDCEMLRILGDQEIGEEEA